MIGKNISEIRKIRKLTLSELAERAGIAKSYLSNIERSINKNPSIQVVEKIAYVLDVDLKELIQTPNSEDGREDLDSEWFDFVNELKESGIEKKEIEEYRTLIEFIKWQKDNGDQKE